VAGATPVAAGAAAAAEVLGAGWEVAATAAAAVVARATRSEVAATAVVSPTALGAVAVIRRSHHLEGGVAGLDWVAAAASAEAMVETTAAVSMWHLRG
jgi:hypothetical protein